MTLDFLWRLPTGGDARLAKLDLWNATSTGAARTGYFPTATSHNQPRRDLVTYGDYLARVARAAEATGFHGVLVPYTAVGEEPWIVASSLSQETRRLHFLPSFHTANFKPVHGARNSATAQRHSGSRIDWNILGGENEAVQQRDGDFTTLDKRYERNSEFIAIAQGVLTHREFRFQGQTYSVEKGGLQAPLSQIRLPTVYVSGSSEAALETAARYGDVYLTWAEPLPELKAKIAGLRERAARHGRTLRFGIRTDVIARPEEETALFDARRLFETADKASLRDRALVAADDIDGSAEERRYVQRFARAGRFEDSAVAPGLYATEGLVRPTAALTLVGSYQQVAETLSGYIDAGIDTVILASSPHLEEAYRIGEDLLPLFGSRRRVAAE